MSGHSKWASIKRSKGVTDAKRGAVFSKHAKAIAVAARAGGDISMNPTLRLAVDRAKADNMPKDKIDTAIKRGTGEDKDAALIEEITYEIIGPEGTMALVSCLTDNKNRTAADVRHLVGKNNGKIADQGAVSRLFERSGYISLMEKGQSMDADEIELLAIDLGAIDIQRASGVIEIYTSPNDLMTASEKLASQGLNISETKSFMKPLAVVRIEDIEVARKVMGLFEILEDHDDVDALYSNVDLSEEVITQLDNE